MTESDQSAIRKSGMESWTFKVGDQYHTLNTDTRSCPICYKNFLNGYNLRRHITTIHLHERTMKLCDKCEASFTSEAALAHHVRFAHEKIFSVSTSVDIAAKKDEKKECPDCEMMISKKTYGSIWKRCTKTLFFYLFIPHDDTVDTWFVLIVSSQHRFWTVLGSRFSSGKNVDIIADSLEASSLLIVSRISFWLWVFPKSLA